MLNKRLDGREYVADDYSIADIAIWPWISRYEWQTIDMNQYPNVKRWYTTIAKKPGDGEGLQGAEGCRGDSDSGLVERSDAVPSDRYARR